MTTQLQLVVVVVVVVVIVIIIIIIIIIIICIWSDRWARGDHTQDETILTWCNGRGG